jgi:L-amino acid N-acyltransferase YncA
MLPVQPQARPALLRLPWDGMKYRLAGHDDSEAIRSIYNREVLGSTVTFDMVARTPEDQLAWLDSHSGAHPAVVAVDDHDRVCGFGSLSPYRPRPAYRTTVEDSVYVGADVRGGGIGRGLLSELLRLAGAHGFHAVMARIVGGHEASIALHRACGFELVGVEREVGRKFGRWLDVVLMQHLVDHAPV